MNKHDKKIKKAKERVQRAVINFDLVKRKGTPLRQFVAAEEECNNAKEEYKKLLKELE